jgi:hypothetical protein
MDLTDLSVFLPLSPITESKEGKVRSACKDVLWDFPLVSKQEFIEAVKRRSALYTNPPEPALIDRMAPAIWDNNRSFIPREFANADTPVWAIDPRGEPVPYFVAESRKARWIAASSYPEALRILDPFILRKGVTTGVLAVFDGYGSRGLRYKVYDDQGRMVLYVTLGLKRYLAKLRRRRGVSADGAR